LQAIRKKTLQQIIAEANYAGEFIIVESLTNDILGELRTRAINRRYKYSTKLFHTKSFHCRDNARSTAGISIAISL